ncbi:MAG TPA: branched-chain amino acid ABC transporter permease [Gammaproteobacteria bacterium]|nr:branched-chain amino acid ABC transporter permease [Gammaproteobacteria bacterium]
MRVATVALVLLAVAAGLFWLPSYAPYFYIFVVTEILLMGLFAASFNLIFGYTGMLSFGHAAFFGMGAYTAALLLLHFQLPLIWVLLLAMLAAALLAALIGFFSVRLNEVYFAMLTLAFGMMAYAVVHQWRSLTNGSDGVAGFPLREFGLGLDLQLADPAVYYKVVLVLVVLASLLLYLITRSPFGLLLRAISENAERVAFCGINVRRYRLLSFTIAGMFAGLAGGLFAPFNRVANPDMVHWTESAQPVLMTILGGAGYFLGPYFGAAMFVLLETWITTYTEQWMLFLGIILAVMVIFFRRGVLGTALDWLMRRR